MKKNQVLPSTTNTLLVKKINGSVTGHDYVNWAVEALTEEFDSPSLAILASLDMGNDFSLGEAEKIFNKVMAELELSIPDDETTLRDHLIVLVGHIKNGTIDPEKGVDRIHKEVVSPLMHPEDLRDWCTLWEGNYPKDYGMIPKEEYPSRILEYAKSWTIDAK